MKKTQYTVTRFDIKNTSYYVEVTQNDKENVYDFVLCLEGYGFKLYMFGLKMEDSPEETWEELIENNIYDYIRIYLDELEKLESYD